MWILGLNGLNLLMISKKNSVLIFQPKIFLKNTLIIIIIIYIYIAQTSI